MEIHPKARRWLLEAVFVILFSAFTVEAQDKLTILSPHWEGVKTEFGRAFEDWYPTKTGRSVVLDWRDIGGTTDDLRFILSEFQQTPSSIGIDLFFGGGMDPYVELEQLGLLHAYRPPISVMDGIPPEIAGLPLYDPKGFWYGAALSSFGILENKRVVQLMKLPVATTWQDLAQPKLKGWVGSGDPRHSGASHMIYESILQAYGWKNGWKVIQGIGANVRQFDRSGSTPAKTCSLGNVAYSIVVDFYGFTQVAEVGTENMRFTIPSGEAVLNPDSIAILKGAPHQEVAERFMDFVLSDEGQSLWLAPRGHPRGAQKFTIERMSIRPKLYEELASVTHVKINPFRDLKPIPYHSTLGTLRWSPLNALIGAFVIDRSPEERGIAKIPVNEEELNQIARTDWKDPVRRNRIQLNWQQAR